MSPSAVATRYQDFFGAIKAQLLLSPCSFQDRHVDQRKGPWWDQFSVP